MPDKLPDELPILRELGDDLRTSFHVHERMGVPGSRLHRARARLIGASGLVAGVAGVVLAFVLGFQGGRPAPASAVAALSQAAAAASRHSPPFPRDDQFLYLRYITTGFTVIRSDTTTPITRAQVRSFPKAIVTTQTQLWSSAGRPGASESHVVSVTFPTWEARRRWERLGRPALKTGLVQSTVAQVGGGHYLLGNIELTRRQLLATSTNPRALYAQLYAAGGSAAEVFAEIGDTLRNRPVPATLRVALYRALALVPGVHLLGRMRDGVGRLGTAVAVAHGGVEEVLIFDPASSEMLAERTVVLGSASDQFGLPVGTVMSTTTYLDRVVTDTPTVP